ncbi:MULTISPECIES: DUF4180 domain-containing protein [Enterococcus]|uniref:DUF4180 domain-containing protein n=1 Tax=Enterococcus TaxID=1350 RepID=UPI00065DF36D|nr:MULTISPECIES: DUF4180 domain-containing protein [Enterococcus]
MNTRIYQEKKERIVFAEPEKIIQDSQGALDLAFSLSFAHDTNAIILKKEAFTEDFFDLRTKLAGEILQKFAQYAIRLAIVGDFSSYTSKALKDFIYECNQGTQVFFVATVEEAVTRLK